jgi:cell division septum initiation protein DivIVA
MPPDHPSAPVPRVRDQVDYNEYTGQLPRANGAGPRSAPRPTRQQNAPRVGAPPQRQDFPPPWAQSGSQGYAAQGYAWQAYGATAQAYAEPAYADPQAYASPQAYADPQAYASPQTDSYQAPQDYPGGRHHSAPHAYARPQRQAGPRRAPGDPRGYQVARGLLHAVPSGPATDFQAETPGGWNEAPPRGQDYAVSLREAAERDAEAIRQQAAQEAAKLTREATQQAARIRQAAEKEAAELRAALATMSGEMGRVAAYVTENLTVPAIPATRPAEAPVTRPTRPSTLRELPAAPPDARPARSPATRPQRPAPHPARPDAAPAARPARDPKQTRQYKAMRVSRFAVAAGLLTVAAAGVTEFAIHGPSFFVFRQGGTGETPGTSTDQQFLANEHSHQAKLKAKVVKPATSTANQAPSASD